MPRDLPLCNGSLLVNFDSDYRIRDIFYPFVGKENHVGGHIFRFGCFVDGRFSWIERANGWVIELTYEQDTLVTQVVCAHQELGLRLLCTDAVDFHANLLVRKVVVENAREAAREVRLYFHQDFRISENEVGDTAAYDPESKAVVHYKGHRYFLASVFQNGAAGVRHWAIGQKGRPDKEGTWRDAEDDGNLGRGPIAQGAVDSVVAAHAMPTGGGSDTVYYWLAVGPSWKGNWDSVRELNTKVVERGPEEYLERTRAYWRLWVNKEPLDFFELPPKVVDLYKRSLLILRTQLDNKGAIIAANDSDITEFNRDTYSYMWPRDGALVAHALDLAGYPEPSLRFFEFCADVLTPEGYLLHKYNPDRSLASSWHPWMNEGEPQLPIQEDETALVVWALWRHFRRYRDLESIRGLYGRLVKKAARFMVRYRDKRTNLPGPSYDLWEERRGILTFSTAAVVGGLHAAAEFAHAFGERDVAVEYEKAAREIRGAMDAFLWRPELGRFARMITVDKEGQITVDGAIDASLYGAFAFGAYPADDKKVAATMASVRERLWCKTDVGGLARYENDYYHQVSQDLTKVPGNPWFICTMWLAQYEIARARGREELGRAIDILQWVESRAQRSGVLAEQVHPFTGAPMSVSPLTWSHATVVTVVQEYLDRCQELELKPQGSPHRYRKFKGLERPETPIETQVGKG